MNFGNLSNESADNNRLHLSYFCSNEAGILQKYFFSLYSQKQMIKEGNYEESFW